MNDDFPYVPLKQQTPQKAFEDAISQNDLPAVRRWIERCPELLDQPNTNDYVPLVQSLGICCGGVGYYDSDQVRPEIFTLLVEAGANIQIRQNDHDGTTSGYTLLSLAVCTGIASLVRLLLDHGADPNEPSQDLPTSVMVVRETGCLQVVPYTITGFPPIFNAVRSGNREIFEMLRAAGAIWDVASTDEWLRCGMFCAAAHGGMSELVQELLDAGTDVNHSVNGWTPLASAALREDTEMLQLLLAAGADPNAVTSDDADAKRDGGRSDEGDAEGNVETCNVHDAENYFRRLPLCAAASNILPDAVRLLLAAGADPSREEPDGTSPLAMAVSFDRTETVRLLLEAGVVCHTLSYSYRNGTLLHEAKSPEIVRMLLAAGVDPNKRNRFGATPLHFVDSVDVAKVLLAAGADVSAVDHDGQTPLHRVYDADVAKVLLAAGADVSAVDHEGDTPLHHVVCWGCSDEEITRMVQVLLAAGGDVDARDHHGETPLHRTITGWWSDEHPPIVKLLLDAGADPNARNDTGNTPFHWAVTSTTDRRVLPWLLEAGADLYAVNANGQTPLDSLRTAMVDYAKNTKNTEDADEDTAYRKRFQRECEIKERWLRERMK